MVHSRCASVSVFCLQNAIFSEWSRGDSNPCPPPCKSGVIVCWSVLEFAKHLQIAVFARRRFSQGFMLFTQVAARVLHSKLANTAKGLHCREDGGGRAQTVLIATKHEDPGYLHSPISGR